MTSQNNISEDPHHPDVTFFQVEFRMSEDDFKKATEEYANNPDNDDVIDYFDYIGDKMIDISYQDTESTIPNDHIFMDLGYQNMETHVDENDKEIHEHVLSTLYAVRDTKEHPSIEESIDFIKQYSLSLDGIEEQYVTFTNVEL